MMRLTAGQTATLSRLEQAQRRFASLVYASLTNRLKLRALMESRSSDTSEIFPEVRLYRFIREPPGYWKMMGLEPVRGGSNFPLDLRLERVPGGVILRAQGEIDLLTVPALREHLNKALEIRQRVLVI